MACATVVEALPAAVLLPDGDIASIARTHKERDVVEIYFLRLYVDPRVDGIANDEALFEVAIRVDVQYISDLIPLELIPEMDCHRIEVERLGVVAFEAAEDAYGVGAEPVGRCLELRDVQWWHFRFPTSVVDT